MQYYIPFRSSQSILRQFNALEIHVTDPWRLKQLEINTSSNNGAVSTFNVYYSCLKQVIYTVELFMGHIRVNFVNYVILSNGYMREFTLKVCIFLGWFNLQIAYAYNALPVNSVQKVTYQANQFDHKSQVMASKA